MPMSRRHKVTNFRGACKCTRAANKAMSSAPALGTGTPHRFASRSRSIFAEHPSAEKAADRPSVKLRAQGRIHEREQASPQSHSTLARSPAGPPAR
eukprot:14896554-Alexandrium_andersonii.AAC.1